jgi:acetyl-CoA C-acetyltransferase
MTDVVITEAVRSPIGRRGGGLSTIHPADLLGAVQAEAVRRAGVDPAEVDQVVGGCVTAVGEQSYNIARTAWLAVGLPLTVPATTVDSQCGSSQQAANLGAGLIASGAADLVLACGVESMSRIPLGANTRAGPGRAIPKSYFGRHEFTSQFEGAERIADKWGVTRSDADQFGLTSQLRARTARDEGWFEPEIFAVEAPDVNDEGKPTGSTHLVAADEGPRETSLEKLAALKPVAREDGIHTAGTSSQISDGAAAVLLASPAKAAALGLRPRARVTHQTLVGVDPVLMLTGPIDATQRILDRASLSLADIDVVEINEAFASVVLAWERELHPDMDKVNPGGGAIALGHPVGATGSRLITTALHHLERTDATRAMVPMCCGGGLGTATLLDRA